MKFHARDEIAYRELIKARSKALQTPGAKEKYSKRYNYIMQRLKDGYKNYLVYYVTDGENDLTEGEYKILNTAYRGVIDVVIDSIGKGDLEGTTRALKILRQVIRTGRGDL